MSAISLKSITGITSITTPAGVDNQLTLHTNNTTERVKIDVAGNVHINNHLAVAGVTTMSGSLRIQNSYPRLYLTDTNHNSDFSIINNDGNFLIYDDTNTLDRFSILANGTVRSHGNFDALGGIDVTGNAGVSGNINVGGVISIPDTIQHVNDTNTKIRFPSADTFTVETGGTEHLRVDTTSTRITDKLAHIGDPNTMIRFPSADTFTVETGGNEVLRITSDRKVGVNNDNPSYTLDVIGDNGGGFTASTNSTAGQLSIVGKNSAGNLSAISRIKSEPSGSTNTSQMVFQTRNSSSAMVERLRITSDGELRVPAGIGAQLRFENQHSVTTDAVISTFDDAAGTLLSLGSNFYYNSSGAETRYNTSEESCAITLNRNGYVSLKTGSTGATATTRFSIAPDGKVLMDNSDGTFTIGGDNVYDNAKINLMVGSMSQTSATTEATALVIHDQNSRRNGTEGSGSWKSKITFRSTQINGNSASEGASIVHDITYNNYSSNKMRSDLIFKTRGDAQTSTSAAATEKLRITHDGKVLISDGSSITPSRHLDVRGTGHQQILLGSTNNAGASLMVDGQGGGDGSGGLYCTFEAASDGDLKIRNYDPTKSIIFGTGSNTGANDSVTIASNGQTTIATAELTITSSSSYTTHINYNNVGTNYITSANGTGTYFRGSSNGLTSLVAHGSGNVELPTANYEFTENTFRSKVAESTGNNNPAVLSGNMTSVEGSKHSWNNTGGILDLPDYKRSDWQILEVYGEVNPNSGGSGVYSDPFFMLIYQGYGYNGSAVTSYIYAQQFSPMARDVFPSGTGNSGADGMSVVWYDGSSESTSCAYNSTTHYLRIKLDTGSFNTNFGCAASVRIFRRL